MGAVCPSSSTVCLLHAVCTTVTSYPPRSSRGVQCPRRALALIIWHYRCRPGIILSPCATCAARAPAPNRPDRPVSATNGSCYATNPLPATTSHSHLHNTAPSPHPQDTHNPHMGSANGMAWGGAADAKPRNKNCHRAYLADGTKPHQPTPSPHHPPTPMLVGSVQDLLLKMSSNHEVGTSKMSPIQLVDMEKAAEEAAALKPVSAPRRPPQHTWRPPKLDGMALLLSFSWPSGVPAPDAPGPRMPRSNATAMSHNSMVPNPPPQPLTQCFMEPF